MKKKTLALSMMLALAGGGIIAGGLLGKNAVATSAEDATPINSLDDFLAFKSALAAGDHGASYILNTDIAYEIEASQGSEGVYRGVFDGNGHTITLSVKSGVTALANSAVIRCLGAAGTIKNLTVDGAISGKERLAGVVSNCFGTLENVVNKVNVTITNQFAGGLVAVANKDSGTGTTKLINCKNYGNVISSVASSSVGIGGLVGWNYENLSITGCSNYGTVENSGAGFGVGGLVGITRLKTGNITISKSYNGGAVNGSYYVGGIFGHVDSATVEGYKVSISKCYSAGPVTATHTTKGYDGTFFGNAKGNAYFDIADSYGSASLTAASTDGKVGKVNGYPKSDTHAGVTLSSTNSTDNVLKAVKIIREFDCIVDKAKATELSTTIAAMNNDEKAILNGVKHYGDADVDNTYMDSANYIIAFNESAEAAMNLDAISQERSTIALVSALGVLAVALPIVLIRRRKRA